MKILVIKFRNIGDVLLTTPLIRNLKFNYPDAKIDFALNEGTDAILKYNPYINKTFVYKRKYIKSLSFFRKIREEINYIKNIAVKKYDLVINLTRGDRGSIISLLSGKIKIGYPSSKNLLLKNIYDLEIPGYGNRHIVDATLDVIRLLNLKIYDKKVEIFWNDFDKEYVKSILPNKRFIHIHPVSRWLFKCVDDKIMAKIIDFIKSKNFEVVITASNDKKEKEKVRNILNLCKSKPINLSGKLTLNQVAYLASKAHFFVGVDTAVMHIAAAVNTPVVAFFGPSAVFNWGPWDNDLFESGYKRRNGIQKMGKHVVIQHDWNCIPCIKDGCNGSKISECLMNFDMEKVFKIIEEKM